MSVKDKLQIILVTYNRKKYLENTLKSMFNEESPIKDFDITILDNKSTDGSSDLIKEYCIKYPNINHIINNRNIGGNANIAQAFTIAKKEYVWVVCDDDMYNWSNWKEVESAINKKYDAIVVDNEFIKYKNNPYDIIYGLSFLPAGIYKTEIIDNDVIRNVYDNIHNWFPHLPLSIKIANTSNNFYILKDSIVLNGQQFRIDNSLKLSKDSLIRDNDPYNIYPEQLYYNWNIAYINSLTLLKGKNKAISEAIKTVLKHPPHNVGKTYNQFFRQIVNVSHNNILCKNLYYDVWYRVNFIMKLFLLWNKILFHLTPFYITPNGVFIRIWKLKTKLIPLPKRTCNREEKYE